MNDSDDVQSSKAILERALLVLSIAAAELRTCGLWECAEHHPCDDYRYDLQGEKGGASERDRDVEK